MYQFLIFFISAIIVGLYVKFKVLSKKHDDSNFNNSNK